MRDLLRLVCRNCGATFHERGYAEACPTCLPPEHWSGDAERDIDQDLRATGADRAGEARGRDLDPDHRRRGW